MSEPISEAALPKVEKEARRPRQDLRQSQNLSVLPNPETSPSIGPFPRHLARYQRVRALASGGNGEVDIWHDQDIGRNVAVKRLKVQRNPAAVAQFVSEVHTVGQLEHPGIVPIYDVGIDEQGSYFFVMKHVEGETLEQIIDKLREGDPAYKRRYSYEARAHIFMQILRAVQYAHSKGYLHCDLKPAKVIPAENRALLSADRRRGPEQIAIGWHS